MPEWRSSTRQQGNLTHEGIVCYVLFPKVSISALYYKNKAVYVHLYQHAYLCTSYCTCATTAEKLALNVTGVAQGHNLLEKDMQHNPQQQQQHGIKTTMNSGKTC